MSLHNLQHLGQKGESIVCTQIPDIFLPVGVSQNSPADPDSVSLV